MTATLPNRVADYLTPPPRLDVPTTSEGRQELWTNAVFQAVALLQSKLAARDPEVAMEAARLLLDLEKTRMRHNRELTGTLEQKKPIADNDLHLPPLPDLDPSEPFGSQRPHPSPTARRVEETADDFDAGDGPTDEESDEPMTMEEMKTMPGFADRLEQLRARMSAITPARTWSDDALTGLMHELYLRHRREVSTAPEASSTVPSDARRRPPGSHDGHRLPV